MTRETELSPPRTRGPLLRLLAALLLAVLSLLWTFAPALNSLYQTFFVRRPRLFLREWVRRDGERSARWEVPAPLELGERFFFRASLDLVQRRTPGFDPRAFLEAHPLAHRFELVHPDGTVRELAPGGPEFGTNVNCDAEWNDRNPVTQAGLHHVRVEVSDLPEQAIFRVEAMRSVKPPFWRCPQNGSGVIGFLLSLAWAAIEVLRFFWALLAPRR